MLNVARSEGRHGRVAEGQRVALVSGGTRGLGLAVVQVLLEQGYKVATFSRTASPAVQELSTVHSGQFHFTVADVSDGAALPPMIAEVETVLGPISALVNNAGMMREALLARQPIETIDRLIEVNLRGSLLLTRQVMRGMMIRRFGRVVNISSIVGIRGHKGTAVYSATKGGIDAMTRALARELGGRNITVNSVAPGYMDTDMVASMDPAHLRQTVRRTPLGRLGTVGDVVGAVVFLLSDAAAFITGQTLVVDGGLTA